MPTVNDVHSRLNETHVSEILTPRSCDELIDIVRKAARQGRSLSICGGRHAMGGQQFLSDSTLVDTTELSAVVDTDPHRGLLTIQGGAHGPPSSPPLAPSRATHNGASDKNRPVQTR